MRLMISSIYFFIFISLVFWGCENSNNITDPISSDETDQTTLKRDLDNYLSAKIAKLKVDDLDGPDTVWPVHKRTTTVNISAYIDGLFKNDIYIGSNILPGQYYDVIPYKWICNGPQNSGSIQNLKFKIYEQVVSYVYDFSKFKWVATGNVQTNTFWTEEIDLYNPGNYMLDVLSGEYLGIHVDLLSGEQ